jgi:hypothetical protein
MKKRGGVFSVVGVSLEPATELRYEVRLLLFSVEKVDLASAALADDFEYKCSWECGTATCNWTTSSCELELMPPRFCPVASNLTVVVWSATTKVNVSQSIEVRRWSVWGDNDVTAVLAANGSAIVSVKPRADDIGIYRGLDGVEIRLQTVGKRTEVKVSARREIQKGDIYLIEHNSGERMRIRLTKPKEAPVALLTFLGGELIERAAFAYLIFTIGCCVALVSKGRGGQQPAEGDEGENEPDQNK